MLSSGFFKNRVMRTEYPVPHLISFPRIGSPDIGYISVIEQNLNLVPFKVERTFWTYFTPQEISRGRHAHKVTEQVLIALAGKIVVTTETAAGISNEFVLENPYTGVYIPPIVWHEMHYIHSSVQLVFASTPYNEADYLRDKAGFISYWKKGS